MSGQEEVSLSSVLLDVAYIWCRALIAGGGAPEIHVSRLLTQYAQTLKGKEAYCFQSFAEALEIIPTTLAENAGLNPIAIVTELRNKHALGERNAGINVKKVGFSPLVLFFSNNV
jgi:chaperonin GroEL (HSP60 family)